MVLAILKFEDNSLISQKIERILYILIEKVEELQKEKHTQSCRFPEGEPKHLLLSCHANII